MCTCLQWKNIFMCLKVKEMFFCEWAYITILACEKLKKRSLSIDIYW